MAGAGGVGGLLCMVTAESGKVGTYQMTYDGNGNIVKLLNASGAQMVLYRYGPFGEDLLNVPHYVYNPFRFSTKFNETAMDGNTTAPPELYDYGFRWYHAGLGRWAARDPIGELGGINIYVALGNNSISNWDLFGLTSVIDILKVFFIEEEDDPEEEGLWIMGEDDEYTDRVEEWEPVVEALEFIAKVAAKNPGYWEDSHITDPEWIPGKSRDFDWPTAYTRDVPSPPGTGVLDVYFDVHEYTNNPNSIPEDLWTSVIGTFSLGVTADDVNREECTMILNIWMLNEMSEQSFGRSFEGYPMHSQFMWWNWKRELKYDENGNIVSINPLPPGQGGGNNPNWPPPPNYVPTGPFVPPKGWGMGWWW